MALAIVAAAVPVSISAQEAADQTPNQIWKQVRLEAARMPDEATRTRFLFDRACALGREQDNSFDASTAEMRSLGEQVFAAVDAGGGPRMIEAIPRFTVSIFRMRQSAVALGYFVGLCDEYTERVRSLDESQSGASDQ